WRLVDQHEEDFAFHVGVFVVVPVVLGCMNAVADINYRRIDLGLRLLGLVVGHVVVEDLQVHGGTAGGHQRERGLGHGGDAGHGHFVHVSAVIACGFKSVDRELGRDVFGGDVASALARASAFQQVMGQEAYVGADPLGIDSFHCSEGRRRGPRRGSQSMNWLGGILGESNNGRAEKRQKEGLAHSSVETPEWKTKNSKDYPIVREESWGIPPANLAKELRLRSSEDR